MASDKLTFYSVCLGNAQCKRDAYFSANKEQLRAYQKDPKKEIILSTDKSEITQANIDGEWINTKERK